MKHNYTVTYHNRNGSEKHPLEFQATHHEYIGNKVEFYGVGHSNARMMQIRGDIKEINPELGIE